MYMYMYIALSILHILTYQYGFVWRLKEITIPTINDGTGRITGRGYQLKKVKYTCR